MTPAGTVEDADVSTLKEYNDDLQTEDVDGYQGETFEGYLHWLNAQKKEQSARLPPTGTAEAICNVIRLMPADKIKYCKELTCAVPNCGQFEHEGYIPRTKCGCGCPE